MLTSLAARLGGTLGPIVVTVLVVAVAVDLVREWRARSARPDLVAVWCEERPCAIDAIERTLAREQIAFHVRSSASRSCMQLLASFAPLDVFVPPDQARRARRVLKRVLAPPPASYALMAERAVAETFGPKPARSEAPAREAAPWRPRTAWLVAIFAVATVGVGFLVPQGEWLASGEETAESDPTTAYGPFPGVEMRCVDDDDDPLADTGGTMPPSGADLFVADVPLGPGVSGPRHFATFTLLDGESLDACRARALGWLAVTAASLEPPIASERFALQRSLVFDPVDDRSEADGWHTVLLAEGVELHGDDFAAATILVTDTDVRVGLELSPEGAAAFEHHTARTINRRIAIVVAGEVVSLPVVRETIRGGRVTITMGRGARERQLADARMLLRALRTGRPPD